LLLRAVAEAAGAFGRDEDRTLALALGSSLWQSFDVGHRVWRVLPRDGSAPIPGFLEDHAALALGFLALHQVAPAFGSALRRASEYQATIATWFWDEALGVYFDTAHDAEALITRPRDITDNATPSGTSLAVELALLISEYTGDPTPRAQALRVLEGLAAPMARHPGAFGHLLSAADLAIHGTEQLVLRGTMRETAPFVAATARQYVPGLVLVPWYDKVDDAGQFDPSEPAGLVRPGELEINAELRRDKPRVDGQATAYLCRGYACERPVTTVAGLEELLRPALRRA
jgi:uncharacterized protein YyaL (SSP411 family)